MKFNKKLLFMIMVITVYFLVSCKDNFIYIDNEPDEQIIQTAFSYIESNDDADAETGGILQNVRMSKTVFQKYDGAIYFTDESGSYPMPSRYNERTGVVTPLCIDPICTHDSPDCPLFTFIAHKSDIYNGSLYFVKNYSDNGKMINDFCGYDFNTGKLTKYYSTDPNNMRVHAISGDIYTGDYRYYYEFPEDEKTREYTVNWTRLNLKTKKTEILGSYDGFDYPVVSFVIDNKLYISSGNEFFTIPSDFKDISEAMASGEVIYTGKGARYSYYDGYIYFLQDNSADTLDLKLHRMKLDGTGVASLDCEIQGYNNFFITQKYIYYIEREDYLIGKVNPDNPDRSNMAGDEAWGVIYRLHRMNHDGSGRELVFQFPDNYYVSGDSFSVYGNYGYFDINGYIYEDDGVSESGEKYVKCVGTVGNRYKRVDLSSGEIIDIK